MNSRTIRISSMNLDYKQMARKCINKLYHYIAISEFVKMRDSSVYKSTTKDEIYYKTSLTIGIRQTCHKSAVLWSYKQQPIPWCLNNNTLCIMRRHYKCTCSVWTVTAGAEIQLELFTAPYMKLLLLCQCICVWGHYDCQCEDGVFVIFFFTCISYIVSYWNVYRTEITKFDANLIQCTT